MAEPDGTFCVVLTTAGSADEGARIAHALVERGLAACVNLVDPIRSIYRWEGGIHDEPEVLLVIKTTAAAWPGLVEAVRGMHSYECPELLRLPVAGGEHRYLAWLAGQVG